MKELTDRLAMMGSPVTEEDRCHVLLLSLPSSYDNLVTTLASPEILVYQTIVNGIIEFEMRIKIKIDHKWKWDKDGEMNVEGCIDADNSK